MAMSATLAISPSTVLSQQQINCTLTVTNSGTATVNVTSIVPQILTPGTTTPVPGYSGMPFLSPGAATSVPPSNGTRVFTWNDVAYSSPMRLGGNGFAWDPSSNSYSITCIVTSDDGSVFSPTAQTVTVSN